MPQIIQAFPRKDCFVGDEEWTAMFCLRSITIHLGYISKEGVNLTFPHAFRCTSRTYVAITRKYGLLSRAFHVSKDVGKTQCCWDMNKEKHNVNITLLEYRIGLHAEHQYQSNMINSYQLSFVSFIFLFSSKPKILNTKIHLRADEREHA